MPSNATSRFQRFLTAFPAGAFSVLSVLLILWLTLSPDPLGENSPRLFPGADKVAHFLMFGFLTAMFAFDRTRRNGWRPVSRSFIIRAAVASTVLGCLIEVAQLKMELGRGFEYTDMVADFVGATVCALGWLYVVNPLLRKLH